MFWTPKRIDAILKTEGSSRYLYTHARRTPAAHRRVAPFEGYHFPVEDLMVSAVGATNNPATFSSQARCKRGLLLATQPQFQEVLLTGGTSSEISSWPFTTTAIVIAFVCPKWIGLWEN